MYITSTRSTSLLRLLLLSICLTLLTGWVKVVTLPATTLADSAPARVQTTPSIVGQWSSPSYWGIVSIHTHLLPNGRVLLWSRDQNCDETGCFGDVLGSTSTRVINPVNGLVMAYSYNSTTNMFCSGHAFLPDGRLLVTGGHHGQDGLGEPHTNIFNSANNTWTRVADMNAGRWYPTNATLGNGEVLVVSGTDLNGQLNTLPQVWQTNIGGGWRSLTGAAGLGQSLYPWMLVAPNGKVFNSGPDQPTRYLDTTGAGAWSFVANSNFGFRDTGSSVMYDDGKVLIVGGGPPTSTAEVIDLNAPVPSWRFVGSMANARRQMNATLLPDGKVLVTGGTSGSGFNNSVGAVFSAEMWDPVTEAWSTMASMQVPRLYHSWAILLPDGRVLAGGGGYPPGTGGDSNHYDVEYYSPPYLFKGARPTITSAPTTVGYNQTFSIATPDRASITKVTWVRLSSVTHSFNQNQRINRLSFVQNATGLSITTPSNGNVCPPGHYMLFIINGNGVPSVAKIIRIN